MTGLYRIAGRLIEIRTLYAAAHELCRDYKAEGSADFSIETGAEDIVFEREKSEREDIIEGRAVRAFSEQYLETLAVYRKIAEKMPEYDTLLFHGSAIAVDGDGYLFTAKSGTGKSTHTRLWRELLGERAQMVNDDKPLIRTDGSGATVFGTPWDGKHRLSNNIAVPLKALCILTRSAENHIEQIAPQSAYTALLQQAYRPVSIPAMTATLALLERLSGAVRLYRLGCNMDIDAARLSFETMRSGK